ncbi:MAG: hypothetical protein II317_03710, partial [Clostridia bacterium]|nr:hypothetical protein [Clostridia bacterium]
MVFYEEKRDLNLSAGSGVGNACERAEGDEASRGGRSGRKNRGKARVAPEDFFGHRKRGCEATSNPSFYNDIRSLRNGRYIFDMMWLCE